MVEEDEQQTRGLSRAPFFFIREEEGEREIRFQSKLINMQFVIPRGGTRVVPLFLFFFLLSLSSARLQPFLRRVARRCD